jgi:outer membrane protein assembly factor BamB
VGDATVDWTMMGYDPGSTYLNRAETTLTKDNAAKLEVIWEKDLGGNVLGGALQVGDKMYASGPGAIFALDAATGNELWKVTASSSSTLGYANDMLYLHSTSGNVMAFKAADGSMVWSMKADASGSDGSSSAIPVGGLVLIGGASGTAELGGGAYRGFMSALDMTTGAKKWTEFTVPEGSTGASFWSTASASIADNLVFGGSGNNYGPPATDSSDSIIAFDWTTGAIKWKFQRVMNDTFPGDFSAPDSDFGNNPVVLDHPIGGAMEKAVYGATKYGYIVALKRLTGELIWKRDICKAGSQDGDKGVFTNFSFSGKGLVAACNEAGPATLISMDPATGDMQWMRALKGRVFGRMAFANGVGFVGTGEEVEAFDVDTGAVIKAFPSKAGTVASTITISRGRVTFGDGISWLPQGLKTGSTLTVLGLK